MSDAPSTHDLTLECENEPLAFSGQIQGPHVLLFLDRTDGTFRYVSANAASLLGDTPEELLGQDGRAWLEGVLPDLIDLPTAAGQRTTLLNATDLGFGPLDAVVSAAGAGWLVEFEPSSEEVRDVAPVDVPEVVDDAALAALGQEVVDAVAAVTGHDRVMLYRFRRDWSGEVIAERAAPGHGSYLGLRFPASDIPAIARALYARLPYRHIPDATAQAVPIACRQGEPTELDLGWSESRSVSPVHLQYLANMGVGASFSVSVMVDGALWGLIACHNSEPRVVPLADRQACARLASDYADALDRHRRRQRKAAFEAVAASVGTVRDAVSGGGSLFDGLQRVAPTLLDQFSASSLAFVADDQITTFGEDVPSDVVRSLHAWSLHEQDAPVHATEQWPGPATQGSDAASGSICGVLSISVRARSLGNVAAGLYLLRPEERSEVAWAGNPDKPVEATPTGGARLSPRNSFDAWTEIQTGVSRAWTDDQLFAAEHLHEQISSFA